jgi:hypothetical protein
MGRIQRSKSRKTFLNFSTQLLDTLKSILVSPQIQQCSYFGSSVEISLIKLLIDSPLGRLYTTEHRNFVLFFISSRIRYSGLLSNILHEV